MSDIAEAEILLNAWKAETITTDRLVWSMERTSGGGCAVTLPLVGSPSGCLGAHPESWVEAARVAMDYYIHQAKQRSICARAVLAAPDLLDACKLAVAALGPLDAGQHIDKIVRWVEGTDA